MLFNLLVTELYKQGIVLCAFFWDLLYSFIVNKIFSDLHVAVVLFISLLYILQYEYVTINFSIPLSIHSGDFQIFLLLKIACCGYSSTSLQYPGARASCQLVPWSKVSEVRNEHSYNTMPNSFPRQLWWFILPKEM